MEIINIAIRDIHPYPNNPRKNSDAVDAVAESIRQCGYCAPIIVDEGHIILAGHTRYKALKKLGWKECPVLLLRGMSDEQKRKYRLLDNKTGELATWDLDALAEELEALDFDGFDFGFELSETVTDEEAQEDDYEVNPPAQPKSKRGDIYVLGRHRLMCGDSTSEDDVQALVGSTQIDMLLTDPPYGVDYTGKTADALKIENDAQTDEDLEIFLSSAFRGADAAMKPGAAFYIWHAVLKMPPFESACQEVGWEVRQVLIWAKNSLVLGRQDYQWQHEPCLYGWKGGAAHKWTSDRKQSTLLNFDRPTKNKEHPTMKPVPLFDYLIKNNSEVGDNILDLFAGSGTLAIACEQNGRNAYMMEYDPKYVDVIIDRWERLTSKKAVLLNG